MVKMQGLKQDKCGLLAHGGDDQRRNRTSLRVLAAGFAPCLLFLLSLFPTSSAFTQSSLGLEAKYGVGVRGLQASATARKHVSCLSPCAATKALPGVTRFFLPPFRSTAFGSPATRKCSAALLAQADDDAEVSPLEALVDFKGAPCVVQAVTDKAEILQLNRKTRKAKFKDLQVVFADRPVRSWELQELDGTLPEPIVSPEKVHAELLITGGTCTVGELSSKLFQTTTTHLTAWAAWKLVTEDLYFTGTTQTIAAHPADRVAKDLEKARAKKSQEKDQTNFVKRVKDRKLKASDMDRVNDVEEMALNRAQTSPTLKLLGIEQTPQAAHTLLLELGVWDSLTNPWPARFGVVMESFPKSLVAEAISQIAAAKKLKRTDFTTMEAFAIDDADIPDPDDAISVSQGEGDSLQVWVHVADVGSVVRPDSELDLAARRRGASCYLPNGTLPMLPERIQESLGLGLANTSPALSIGFVLEDDGHIDNVQIVRSTIKVTRKSYAEAAVLMEKGDGPWSLMEEASFRFRDRRLENGAVGFQMPQSVVSVRDGKVDIKLQEHFDSNDMVMEMMLMAGEAVSQYALDKEIPFLFSTQGPLKDLSPAKYVPKKQLLKGGRAPAENPFEIANQLKEANKEKKDKDRIGPPETLAEMFEFRKRFERSQQKTKPDTHTGLGMSMYCQISSPLRRYSDLVLHQQLHAALNGEPLLSEEELLQRVTDTEEQVGATKKAERFSSQYYTLNWLKANPDYTGGGTCCALWQPRPGTPKIATVLLKDLAFFANVRCKQDVKTDEEMSVALSGVRLVEMKADMRHNVNIEMLYGTEEAEMFKRAAKSRKQVGTRLSTQTKRQG